MAGISVRYPAVSAAPGLSVSSGRTAVEVGVELGHRRGRPARRHPDQLGGGGHLGHVPVPVRVAELRPVAFGGGEPGVHLRRVHPDEQVGVARRVGPPGHRVGAADPLVDPSHPVGGRAGGRPVAVGRGQHVGGGGREPAGRVVPPLAVLVDAGHGQRVQRLQQQRPQPGDGRRQVGVQSPGDAARAEEAVVGRIGGHAGGEGRGATLEQPATREDFSRHGYNATSG